MDARKLARFDGAEHMLACPICGGALARTDQRLCCPAGHSFDIARQGYANLLRNQTSQQHYDRTSFAMRRRVFQSGLYDAIAHTIAELASHAVERLEAQDAEHTERLAIVDAGCGEGFFSRAIRAACDAPLCAFDISRDSIQLAATTDPAMPSSARRRPRNHPRANRMRRLRARHLLARQLPRIRAHPRSRRMHRQSDSHRPAPQGDSAARVVSSQARHLFQPAYHRPLCTVLPH